MKKIKIGQIVNAVGIKGEVKIYSYSEDPDRFETIESILVEDEEYWIDGVRYKGITPILKLEGIDDRNAAEAMKGKDVFMDEADLPELPEGEYYVKDIVGFKVVTTDGMELGALKDVNTNTPQKLYVVSPSAASGNDASKGKAAQIKDILIPGVPQFILNIDTDSQTIEVSLPEGLLEL